MNILKNILAIIGACVVLLVGAFYLWNGLIALMMTGRLPAPYAWGLALVIALLAAGLVSWLRSCRRGGHNSR